MYAKDISNKIKSVKHNKQDLGLFIGSKAPFGYKINPKIPNKLFIDNEAKPIVERIFKEAALGKSCRCIAMALNNDKICTPSQYAVNHGYKVSKQTTNWSDSRVRELLLNEVYIGNMVQGRMKKVNYKSKKNIRLPKKDWKIVKNTHEPLIDLNTFQKANEMIFIRKQTRVKSHDYLLKGFVYCHECRKKMYCSSRRLSSGIKYYFRCSSNTLKRNSKTCTSHSIRMDYVEQIIVDELKKIVRKYHSNKLLEQLAEDYCFNKLKNDNSCALQNSYMNKLHQITREIDKLYADKISRTFTKWWF